MRACWLKWVGRDWSFSADYIWLNYSDANSSFQRPLFCSEIIRYVAFVKQCKQMSQSRSREPCRSWSLEVVFAWTRPCGSLAFHGSDFKEKRGIFAKCPSCLRHKWHSTPSYEVFDIVDGSKIRLNRLFLSK